MTKSQSKVAAAFREVHRNPPAVVANTRRKKGAAAAKAQMTAIALSKARAAGARVRRRPNASPAPTDAELRQGYRKIG